MPAPTRPFVAVFRVPGAGREVVVQVQALDRVDALSQLNDALPRMGIPQANLISCAAREPEPVAPLPLLPLLDKPVPYKP